MDLHQDERDWAARYREIVEEVGWGNLEGVALPRAESQAVHSYLGRAKALAAVGGPWPEVRHCLQAAAGIVTEYQREARKWISTGKQ